MCALAIEFSVDNRNPGGNQPDLQRYLEVHAFGGHSECQFAVGRVSPDPESVFAAERY
jgi:hypothetical protein